MSLHPASFTKLDAAVSRRNQLTRIEISDNALINRLANQNRHNRMARQNQEMIERNNRLSKRLDSLEESSGIGPANRKEFYRRLRERIDEVTQNGTPDRVTYAKIRDEVEESMANVPIGRRLTRPSEEEISAWVVAWKKACGLGPQAPSYPSLKEDAATLIWHGFTVEQVRASGLPIQKAAMLAGLGQDLPQEPQMAMRANVPQQYSRQSAETAARVRDRLEYYSRRGQWKPYAEIVAEVERK